ncbi:hypothetical protein J2808_000230 [Pseudarthrobacter sulfonivorans]|nr:hypothetical protein [Pseudarthrobacter sulfonivorans]
MKRTPTHFQPLPQQYLARPSSLRALPSTSAHAL